MYLLCSDMVNKLLSRSRCPNFHCNGKIILKIFFAWNSGSLPSGPWTLPILPTPFLRHCKRLLSTTTTTTTSPYNHGAGNGNRCFIFTTAKNSPQPPHSMHGERHERAPDGSRDPVAMATPGENIGRAKFSRLACLTTR